jgi:type VI secretion system protein ImpA
MVNLDELLQPVTADAPGGANLEYSPEFAELERTAAGKPERQVGANIVPAEDPDWRALIAKSSALLALTKDLRVANHLVLAWLRVEGFVGLGDGLQVLADLVDRYWPSLHPALDPDDGNDPTLRVNVMATVTHRDTLQTIRATPFLRVKSFGALALKDIEAAAVPSNGQAAQAASIEAAFQQVPLEELTAAANAAQRCVEQARRLADAWGAHTDGLGPDFTELRRVLAQLGQVLSTRVAQRQPSSTTQANGTAMPDSASANGTHPAFAGGVLHSRDDVVRALDAICAYYARHEPSSPVPLFLERCKRLVTMSFLDIVKDMVPDGMSTIRNITGKRED